MRMFMVLVLCSLSSSAELRRGLDTTAGQNLMPYTTWFPGRDSIFRVSGGELEVCTDTWPAIFKHTNLSLPTGPDGRYAPPEGYFVVAPEMPEMERVFAGPKYIRSDNLRIAYFPSERPLKTRVLEADWTHRIYRLQYRKGKFLEYTVSRLSPAVLFETNDSHITLFTGIAINLTYGGNNNTMLGTCSFGRALLRYVKPHPEEFPPPREYWYLQD